MKKCILGLCLITSTVLYGQRASFSWSNMVGVRGHQIVVNLGELNPEEQDRYGRTLLGWAASLGNVDILRHLLEVLNLDPNVPGRRGKTPLMEAADQAHSGAACLLLEEGAYAATKDDKDQTALIWTVVGYEYPSEFPEKRVAIIDCLIEAGAETEDRDQYRRTALLHASMITDPPAPEILEALIEAGADPTVGDRFGYTALQAALDSGSGMAPLLRAAGAVR